MRARLGLEPPADLGAALDALAELRADLPPTDAVALVREGRVEPEQRGP
jgi:hypothetical protein